MSKNTAKKTNVKSPRIYFISNNPDEDLTKIKSFFDSEEDLKKCFHKVYKTTTTTKETSNILLILK